MSGDYEGPKRREAKLRNRAVRRTRWLQRKWRVSAKGNSFLNVDGHNLGVHPTKTKRGIGSTAVSVQRPMPQGRGEAGAVR
jgi:hypothetical protein